MAQQGWFADPTGRHELRWWDGAAWSDHVSDRGHTGHDPLVPVAPAVPTAPVVPPAWQPDPTGRNELRYWDGTQWTDNVSNRGVMGVDPVAGPAPQEARPEVSAPADTPRPEATPSPGAPPEAAPAPGPSTEPVQGTSASSYFADAPAAGAGPVPDAPDAPAPPEPAGSAVDDAAFAAGLARGSSGLLFLSANEILPKASVLTGIKPPCSEERVSRRQVAGTLIAAALLDLREAGVISLELGERKGMFGRTDVRVTLRRLGPGTDAPGWGVAFLAHAGDEHDVRELVASWIGRMMADPYGYVLGYVEAELVARGVMSYAEDDGLGSRLASLARGRAKTEVDCDAAAALLPEREAAVAAWRSAMADGDLLDKLVDECNLAVQGQELHT